MGLAGKYPPTFVLGTGSKVMYVSYVHIIRSIRRIETGDGSHL